jgi:hypothetical protein
VKPSEMFPDVAAERMRSAVANCERIKLEAMQRAAVMAGADIQLSKPPMRSVESTSRSLAVVGRFRKALVHADLNGVSRREYTTSLSRLRRDQLYAKGMTSRGTPRVVPAEMAFRGKARQISHKEVRNA